MAPDILAVMTPDLRENAPEPLLYHDLVYETGFDPWEPWYPCGCPHRLDDIHVDDCWLDWLALPMWMREDTTEVPTITGQLAWAVLPDESDVDGAGGWCAPAETMNWCGHPLREDCGCEFAPVPIGEIVIDLVQREVSEVDDDTVLLGVVEPLDEDEEDSEQEEAVDGDVQGRADEDTVDNGDGRSGE